MSAESTHESDISLISRVLPGDTINIVTKQIVKHNSWYTWVTRNWYGETKDKLVEWISTVVREEFKKIKQTRDIVKRKIRTEQLSGATTGIRNLCSTYYGTPVVNKLTNIIGAIDKLVAAVGQGYSESIIINDADGIIVIDTRFGRSW